MIKSIMYFDSIKSRIKDLFCLVYVCIYRGKDKSVKYQTSGNYPKAIHDER